MSKFKGTFSIVTGLGVLALPHAVATAAVVTSKMTEVFGSTFTPTSNLAYDPTTKTYLEAATQGIFRVNTGRTDQTLITSFNNATGGTGNTIYGITINPSGNGFSYGSNAGLTAGVGGIVTETVNPNGSASVATSSAFTTGPNKADTGYGVFYGPTYTSNGAPYVATTNGSQNNYGTIIRGTDATVHTNLLAVVATNVHTNLAVNPNTTNFFYGVGTQPAADVSNVFTVPTSGGGNVVASVSLDSKAISGLTFLPDGDAFGVTNKSLYEIANDGSGQFGNEFKPLISLTAATTGTHTAGQTFEPQLVVLTDDKKSSELLIMSGLSTASGTPVLDFTMLDANNNATNTAVTLDPQLGSKFISVVAESFTLHTANGVTTGYDAVVDAVTDKGFVTYNVSDTSSTPEPSSLMLVGGAVAAGLLGRRRAPSP